MRKVEVLIIGGGVAGTTAAETYRHGGGAGEVVIVSDEAHPLYSRVLLPHAAKGKIPAERAFLKTDDWYKEKNIELLTGRSVTHVDYKRRVAALDGGEEIEYGELVIAVGARPRHWDVPGAELLGVLRLQTYEDALTLRDALSPKTRMLIVGSGFIGLEFAAIAIEKDVPATIINRGPHFWTSVLGEGIGVAVQKTLEAKGVHVRNHAKVEAVLGEEAVSGARLSKGEEIACTMIGVGIGAEPPMDPFGDLKGDHGILADAHLKAKHEHVLVAGDCAEFEDAMIGGYRHIVGNWANGVAQGRHVGQALLGRDEPFTTLTSYSSNVVPGVNLIFLGETKLTPGIINVERVIEPGRKLVEFRVLNERVIGAIILNAPDQRAEIAARIASGVLLAGREHDLADPAIPLDRL